MSKDNGSQKEVSKTKLFQQQSIRTHWDDDQQQWFFSVQDVVQVLSESRDVKQYIKKMRQRDPELNGNWGTICTPVAMLAADGRMRKIQAANTQGLLRLIQSIPSPKAEPFKQWLAEVGAQRIAEDDDPELSFDRAMQTYLAKGYSKEWINQRLKSIEVRKELTDEWAERGMKQGLDYAILTNALTEAWAGKSVKDYKQHKGLKTESLRDNMSNIELVLNMLAEASTTEISKKQQPQGLADNKAVAEKGGNTAKQARVELEKQIGESVVSKSNARQLLGNGPNE